MSGSTSRGLRVDQLLSRYGYASRREAAAWLKAGRVTLEGTVLTVKHLDTRVDPHRVSIDGEAVEAPDGLLAMLHKPAGVVCTRSDGEGRTVFELLPPRWSERNPPVATVGRLDRDTTGLLLVTDLGVLVHRLTSPRHHVEKVYEVGFEGTPRAGLAELFASGMLRLDGEDRPCAPARVEFHGPGSATLRITEGRYHQVKRMFESVGLRVLRLHRPTFGEYSLGDLPVGSWRLLPVPAGVEA